MVKVTEGAADDAGAAARARCPAGGRRPHHGAVVAREVARCLVFFVQRAGGQRQVSAQLAAQRPIARRLRELEAWRATSTRTSGARRSPRGAR